MRHTAVYNFKDWPLIEKLGLSQLPGWKNLNPEQKQIFKAQCEQMLARAAARNQETAFSFLIEDNEAGIARADIKGKFSNRLYPNEFWRMLFYPNGKIMFAFAPDLLRKLAKTLERREIEKMKGAWNAEITGKEEEALLRAIDSCIPKFTGELTTTHKTIVGCGQRKMERNALETKVVIELSYTGAHPGIAEAGKLGFYFLVMGGDEKCRWAKAWKLGSPTESNVVFSGELSKEVLIMT